MRSKKVTNFNKDNVIGIKTKVKRNSTNKSKKRGRRFTQKAGSSP